jgi:hypothetical protein
VEQTPERASSDFIDDVRLQIDIEGTGNMFSGGSLRKEGAKAVIAGRGSSLGKTAIGLYKDLSAASSRKAYMRSFTLRPCSTVYSSPVVRELVLCEFVEMRKGQKRGEKRVV